ncbi:uncharacterized protein TRAVEDRAFT_51277 [Trametes versicolor FP-101664 SS1]|uniref:uncharacterized protein n=1 Tax=Trametes versicolor (strain FP-101664) TaxID=717944 RepID=UPI000462360C|nr:uncharacterized protein TRAVEDRAFT_51277 [Trametes versicolor FP-101664 SS1]EIW55149.1 hypothetical protein TRAVEDRAFT_51277 [Trametes versicolor FP-101664 SS1]
MVDRTDIVQKLRNYLNDQQFVQTEFARAFEMAKEKAGPLFEQFEIKIETVDDYLDYYDMLVKWVPTETKDGTYVYNHLCLFYFVLGQDPLLGTQSTTRPTTHSPYTWLSRWIIEYAKEMGKWMDTTESITAETIATFYKAESYHMEEYEDTEWQTFNEFFARRLKPGVRPIDGGLDDNTVIVSPADAKFDIALPVEEGGVVKIKGVPWSITQLLDHDRGDKIGPSFDGGMFCHSLPTTTTASTPRFTFVPGDDNEPAHLRMRRSMDVDNPARRLDVPNDAGYQFIQARALILIDTTEMGLVAVLPIGMAQVSSVKLSVGAGDKVKKGDELAYFQLGGSDVVTVFQERANVTFTAEANVHYNYGKQIATANPLPDNDQ